MASVLTSGSVRSTGQTCCLGSRPSRSPPAPQTCSSCARPSPRVSRVTTSRDLDQPPAFSTLPSEPPGLTLSCGTPSAAPWYPGQ
ncbi:hypothetical protein JEQ12_013390 [Ovis aries]|uniref:Uncharacterized protein n=1 Tax=Ovis aries TaxID=9940 RepID=A0A836AJH9_SHEEP|nr:hypothetical protein JEQ12_013390 [Ovis aries]